MHSYPSEQIPLRFGSAPWLVQTLKEFIQPITTRNSIPAASGDADDRKVVGRPARAPDRAPFLLVD